MYLYNHIYNLKIGCEIHINIKSKKIFSNTINSIYEKAIPGILPYLNYSCFKTINYFFNKINNSYFKYSLFERKMYFYYDVPKNYQLTQNFFNNYYNLYFKNFCNCNIFIKKIHLEEDSASSEIKKNKISYLRSGNALIEIVTEPCFKNFICLIFFLKKIIYFLKKNNISDCNLNNGEFRCDINISILNKFNLKISKKNEIKNLNSFENIKKSIIFELKRQIYNLEYKKIFMSTRNYQNNLTKKIRKKNFSFEYNYEIDYDLRIISFFDYEYFYSIKIINLKNIIFKKFPKKIYLKKNFIKKKYLLFFFLYSNKNKFYLNKKIIFNFNILKILKKYKNKILFNNIFKIFFLKIKKYFNLFNY